MCHHYVGELSQVTIAFQLSFFILPVSYPRQLFNCRAFFFLKNTICKSLSP
nr:MAG TPA: hypothetical protein [Caudoviricetes sp.]